MSQEKEIKSPISQEVIFESKLEKLFEAEGIKTAFIFYISKEEEENAKKEEGVNYCAFDSGMCGHELLRLAEIIEDMGERRLEENPHEQGGDY